MLAILLAGGGAAAFVIARDTDDSDGSSGSSGDLDDPRPPADVTLIAGRADALSLSLTLLEPVTTPVTVEALDRGAASARISPVTIEGREQSVVWEGGTPLVIEGADGAPGSIAFDPTPVEITTAGVAVDLEGAVGALTPGRYSISVPVAIGGEGLARPVEGVTFEATDATVVAFEGSAVLALPAEPATFEGPGEGRLVGDVEVTMAGADRRLTALEFGPGPYRFDVVWLGDRIELDGRVEGGVRTVPAPDPPE